MDRELGSSNPPFLPAWEIRQLERHNALLEAHLKGETSLKEIDLEAKLAEYVLPEIPHPFEQKLTELASQISEIECELNYLESDEQAEQRVELKALKKEHSQLRAENIKRLESQRKRLQSHLRAMEGKPGRLLTDEEYESLCPSPKIASPKAPELTLKSHPLGELFKEGAAEGRSINPAMSFMSGSQGYYSTIHALEIDWTLSETNIIDAFRNWLRKRPSPYHPGHNQSPQKGRKDSYPAWFQELAIFRLGRSGITKKEGMSLLGIRAISDANWSHAKARTRKRIDRRLRDLETIALNAHHWGGSSRWQDHFATL